MPSAKDFRLSGTEARWRWLSHVVERWVKISAAELGESLTLGREGRLNCLITKTSQKWVWRGLVDLSTMSNGSTLEKRIFC